MIRKTALAAIVALLLAGGALAAGGLHVIHLRAGSCVTVKRAATRVCAAPAVTVYPQGAGKHFTGSGILTIAPFTLSHGAELHWSYTNDPVQLGLDLYNQDGGIIASSHATSGSSYLPPGAYTLQVSCDCDWTIDV